MAAPHMRDLYAAALPADAPGAWVRAAIDAMTTPATLRLYHRTTPEAAAAIVTTGRWQSYENGWCYFSTARDGEAIAYGTVVLGVEVPADVALLDDEWSDGETGAVLEAHYRVHARDLAGVPVEVS